MAEPLDPGTGTTWVYDCDHRFGLPFGEVKAIMGGKAANLAVMAVDLGLPVPPAFTITTAACNAYLASGWPAGLDAQVRAHMAGIEARIGRRFGDPADPLLVSVRSGAPVSMPGMMDTILNLGLNEATTRGLAAASASPQFAADCLTRFEQMFRTVVGEPAVPDDPWLQLRAAVEAVFRSWNSDRARTYRRREGIADDLGTAVTIQAMVFGNRSLDSGTGVLFTRNPATGEPAMYGDVMFNAQGEDVVAGSHRTQSLAELAVRLPAVASELEADARALERYHRDLCDIEFTIERGKLWLLQCRTGKRSPQAALRIARDMADDGQFPLSRAEAVERVAAVLADPPTLTTGRAAGLAGRGDRRDRHDARGRDRSGRRRPAGHPRPGRDLARRCPRHGPGSRPAHLARRPRQPRGGRRPRLGDPGGRRSLGPGGQRQGGRDRQPAACPRDADHDRRQHRRDLRGPPRHERRDRARGGDAPGLGRRARDRDPGLGRGPGRRRDARREAGRAVRRGAWPGGGRTGRGSPGRRPG